VVAGPDTLHLFVYHAPSRYGGERETRPHRQRAMQTLLSFLDRTGLAGQHVIVAGDFNDYAESSAPMQLQQWGLTNVSAQARGRNGEARGTYRYHGEWRSLDHVFVSSSLLLCVTAVYINDAAFLLEDEPVYGGKRPFRTFNGYRYQRGYSDHLPLVVQFGF
jgi:predicted extracellular nuclease